MMDKYHPGYFGKVGMRHFNLRKNQYHCPIVNLDKLWALVGEDARVEAASSKAGAPVIDVTKYGIYKVRLLTVQCALVLSQVPWFAAIGDAGGCLHKD
jgi:ribosomal protein L15